MRKLKTRTTWLALATAMLLGTSLSQASQDSRQIYINGERLDAFGMSLVDQLNCDAPVPNGRYWLNFITGEWGYQGGPTQGVIGNCRTAQPQSDRRYVEDRIFEQSGASIIQNPVYSQ
jgi:hypothetical protein